MKIHSLSSIIIGIVFTIASLDGYAAAAGSSIQGLNPVKSTGSTTTSVVSESNAVTVLTSGVERNPVSAEPNHWVGNYTVPVGKNLLCPKDQIPYAVLTPFSVQQDSGTGFAPLCVVKVSGEPMQWPIASGSYSKWTVDTGVYANRTPNIGGTYSIAYYVAPLSDKNGNPLLYTVADNTGPPGKVVGATPFNWTIYCYPKSTPPPTAITTAECKKPRSKVYVPPISQTYNFYRGNVVYLRDLGSFSGYRPVVLETAAGSGVIPLAPMASKSNPTAATISIPADGVYTFQLKANVVSRGPGSIRFWIWVIGGPGGSGTGYPFLEGNRTVSNQWQAIKPLSYSGGSNPSYLGGGGDNLTFEGTAIPTSDPYNINSTPLILTKGVTTVRLSYEVTGSNQIIMNGELTMTRTGP